MTTKEKKEYILLAVILFAMLLVLYFSFFNKPKPAVTADQIQAAMSVAPSLAAGTAAPAGAAGATGAPPTATASISAGPFLPHGTNLNLKILQDQRFQRLLAPVYPTVDISDVGQTDPFATGSNSSSGSGTGANTTNTP